MIYVNNELQSKKPDAAFKTFKNLFSGNIDQLNNIRPSNPIILKYKPELYQKDKDNPGKVFKPASIGLSYVARVVIEGSNSIGEIRYSPIAPFKEQNGNLKFTVIGTEVSDRMPVYDIDLAFFLWHYSQQVVDPRNEGPNVWFQIENPEMERKMLVMERQEKSILESRLFNPTEEGGISDRLLRVAGKLLGIANADIIQDPNQLRIDIDNITKNSPVHRKVFLNATDHKTEEKKQTDADFADMMAILNDALEYQIVSHQTYKQGFFLNDGEGGKPKTELFNYKHVASNDKTPRKDVFFLYLKENKPEILEEWSVRIKALKEAKIEAEGIQVPATT